MIYTSNLVISGALQNITSVYANSMTSGSSSNIQIRDSIDIAGSVFTTGRMDLGKTIFATFRLNSNLPFSGASNERTASTNLITFDPTNSDMSGMSGIPSSVQPQNIFNSNNGVITVPTSGFYHLNMQANFSNSASASNIQNGVYYKFLNHSYSNARISPVQTSSATVSTSAFTFLLAGDTIQPTFYSTDNNATLLATNGETFVGFTLLATVTPLHSNYYRV